MIPVEKEDASRAARDKNGPETAHERHDADSAADHVPAIARDALARRRDAAASARDRAADGRDRIADERDVQIGRTLAAPEPERTTSAEQAFVRAARERERAADDRAHAAAHRGAGARDRGQAAGDRLLAAQDRVHAASERAVAAVDPLTGTRRRGPGLEELQREIARARRGTGRLVVAYVDLDGLKVVNDTKGHRAGDALLRHVVAVMRANLRFYELIVRLGGDEFLCVLSEATIGIVRSRFDQIAVALTRSGADGSVTVGFADLQPDDTVNTLIERADADLLSARGARSSRPSAVL